jgi:hypothetical protein
LLAASGDGVCAGETWAVGDDVAIAGAGDGLLLVEVGWFVQLLANKATMQALNLMAKALVGNKMYFIKKYLIMNYQICTTLMREVLTFRYSIQSPGTQSVNGKKVRKKQGFLQ